MSEWNAIVSQCPADGQFVHDGTEGIYDYAWFREDCIVCTMDGEAEKIVFIEQLRCVGRRHEEDAKGVCKSVTPFDGIYITDERRELLTRSASYNSAIKADFTGVSREAGIIIPPNSGLGLNS